MYSYDFNLLLCLHYSRYDYIEVEDQSVTNTIIWGRWCGQKAPQGLTSKTNKLRVTFKSDDYFVAKPGFKIYYSLVVRDLLVLLLLLLLKHYFSIICFISSSLALHHCNQVLNICHCYITACSNKGRAGENEVSS